MVRPCAKYFWKNGNTTSIGPAAMTHMANFSYSLGSILVSSETLPDIMGLFARFFMNSA